MFAHTNLITYESLYSSSYLLNEYLLYDKLWGPSQRVVTLLSLSFCLHSHKSPQGGVLKILINGNQRVQVNGWQVCGTMDLTRLVVIGGHRWSLVVIGSH